MRVLSIVHLDGDRPGLFAEAVLERGHVHDEWWIHHGDPAPASPESYDGVALFGGDMAVGDEDAHPWLREEKRHLRRLLRDGTPILGVCLGGQLLADVAGAPVSLAARPEVGWYDIELLPEARRDQLFRGLPERFPSFQWHSWQFALPRGGVPLARNRLCLQAFRLGETAWGVQFHPEPTPEDLAEWLEAARTKDEPRRAGFDFERERALSERNIAGWNEVGRTLFSRFVALAETRTEVPARRATA